MRITEEGRIGVGTAKPEATLDVAGTVRVSEVPGTLAVTGNMNANNSPGVAFSQSHEAIEIAPDNGSADLNQVRFNVPANGFLFISAFVNLRTVGNGYCMNATFKLIRDEAEELVTMSNGSQGSVAGQVRNGQTFHLAWVIPVTAGPVNLKTHVVSNSCDYTNAHHRNQSVI